MALTSCAATPATAFGKVSHLPSRYRLGLAALFRLLPGDFIAVIHKFIKSWKKKFSLASWRS